MKKNLIKYLFESYTYNLNIVITYLFEPKMGVLPWELKKSQQKIL